MITIELPFFLVILTSLFLAWLCKWAFCQFASNINRQVYEDYASLVLPNISEAEFQTQSQLQPQNTQLANGFFLLFPLLLWLINDPIFAFLLMILAYLSLLDYTYYLTDSRALVVIFTLSQLNIVYRETLLFCLFLFGTISLFYRYLLKKHALGIGDSLLFIALSSLFPLPKMLFLILVACLLGIVFYLTYWQITKQKIAKLPFIPFITLSTLIAIIPLQI